MNGSDRVGSWLWIGTGKRSGLARDRDWLGLGCGLDLGYTGK